MSAPRILLITRNLPPLVGGMERLNWHMADELSQAAEIRSRRSALPRSGSSMGWKAKNPALRRAAYHPQRLARICRTHPTAHRGGRTLGHASRGG